MQHSVGFLGNFEMHSFLLIHLIHFLFFRTKKNIEKMVVESPLFLVKSPFFYSFPMVSYDIPWFWCFELFIWWILQASSGARAWTSLVPDGERLSRDLARDGQCTSVLLMSIYVICTRCLYIYMYRYFKRIFCWEIFLGRDFSKMVMLGRCFLEFRGNVVPLSFVCVFITIIN